MSPVSKSMREVAAVLRQHSGFNDLAVDRAFKSMAGQLEMRADAIQRESDPAPVPAKPKTHADKE